MSEVAEAPNLSEWRERAEFWASRDPDAGLYDAHAVAFAGEVVTLLDRLREVLHERDGWRDQVVVIREQQRDALARAEKAEAAEVRAHGPIRTDVFQRNLGTCPTCRGFLWASVAVETTVRLPDWRDDAHPTPRAFCETVSTRLSHYCKHEDD